MNNLELLKEKASCFKCSNCKTTGNRLIAPSTAISGQYYITCMTCGNVTVAKENLGKDGQVAFTVNETSKTKKTAATELLMNDAMKSYEAMGYPLAHKCMSPKDAEKYVIKEEIKKEIFEEMKNYINIHNHSDEDELDMDMEEVEHVCDCEEPCEVCTCCKEIDEDIVDEQMSSYLNGPVSSYLKKHEDKKPSISIDCDYIKTGTITTDKNAIKKDKMYMIIREGAYLEAMYIVDSLESLAEKLERDCDSLDNIEIYEISREIKIEKKLSLS